VLGAVRAFGINRSFGVFHDYIIKLENAFANSDAPGGWEHYNASHDTGWTKGAVLFWIIINISTFAVAILRFLNKA
jgi:hypothetical protein